MMDHMTEGEVLENSFVGSVTVGERGQVVVPVEARERCGIQPGAKLLCFVHPHSEGVIFVKVEAIALIQEQLHRLASAVVSAESLEDEGASA